jgi:hypothetical protein
MILWPCLAAGKCGAAGPAYQCAADWLTILHKLQTKPQAVCLLMAAVCWCAAACDLLEHERQVVQVRHPEVLEQDARQPLQGSDQPAGTTARQGLDEPRGLMRKQL